MGFTRVITGPYLFNSIRGPPTKPAPNPHLGFAHGIQHFLWCFHLSCAIVVFEPQRMPDIWRFWGDSLRVSHKMPEILPVGFNVQKSLRFGKGSKKRRSVMIFSPTWPEVSSRYLSHEKDLLTFHDTGCSIGILIMVSWFVTSQIYTIRNIFQSSRPSKKLSPAVVDEINPNEKNIVFFKFDHLLNGRVPGPPGLI